MADLMESGVAFGDRPIRDALERLGELRRLVDAAAIRIVEELEQPGDEVAMRWGERSTASLVAAVAGVDEREAHDWCEVSAATRPRYALSGERLEPLRTGIAGAVETASLAASVLARVVATADEVDRRAPGHGDAVAAVLLEQAPGLSARALARICRHAVDCADPDGVEPREEELRRRRGVRIAHLPDGMLRWTVTMDPESAGFLGAALDARTAPRREPRFDEDVDQPVEHDERTPAQRRLDALVGIARTALRADDGSLAGTDVTMLVTVPLEVLRTGVGAAWIDGVELPMSAGAARRLAGCADIVPVVLGGASEPLDLGRTARLFSRAQRRALNLRDGGCLWPGCQAPPGWCEVAHIEPWAHGGPTDLRNAMLLCPYHHRRFDLDGWTLQIRGSTRWLVPPASVDPSRTPRRIIGRAEQLAATAAAVA